LKKPLDVVFSAEDKLYTLATVGNRSSTYPALLFNSSAETTEELGKRAAELAALGLNIPFVLCRADSNVEECVAVPSFDIVLNLLKDQKLNEPVAFINADGTVYAARLYEFYRLCTRPWRISGGCEECIKTNNRETPGEPCPIKAAQESPDDLSDIDVDDFRETLKKAKHPPIGEYRWVSPMYTKTDSFVKNSWGRHKERPAAFQPYIRDVSVHDFSVVDEFRERQCQAAQTKAKIQRLIKQVCATCTLKSACDKHHQYNTKRYVAYCNSATHVKGEQLIAAYADRYKDFPKESMSYVLKNVGPLPWRHDRHKLFMSVDLDATSPRISIRHKTSPRHATHRFKSFQEAEEYLRKHDKEKSLYQPDEGVIISDMTLALYEMSCQYNSSPRRNSGWHSTSYSTRYIEPRYESVRIVFSNSSERDELYWSLDVNDIFDGFRYYGHQHIPRYWFPDQLD